MSLKEAVFKQLGFDCPPSKEDICTLENISEHGISGGYQGFSYYYDTTNFFDENRKDILSYLLELSDDLGVDVISIIKGFNCIDESISLNDIGAVVYGGESHEDEQTIKNALTWFAGEEVARSVVDELEDS